MFSRGNMLHSPVWLEQVTVRLAWQLVNGYERD